MYDTIQEIFLAKFLPKLKQSTLNAAIKASKIKIPLTTSAAITKPIEIKETLNELQIGTTKIPITNDYDITKIPNVTFYNVPQHINVMESILKDYQIGSHLLLIGNQGVGKNKIIDRLLQLMKKSREYIQLHRDTTVQSLTTSITIDNGHIKYIDSPLIKACRYGHILIIDEADKAPTHVTSILKTIIDNNGQITLSDGRKLINNKANNNFIINEKDIIIHKNFRLILLANRPGHPFLGNNFFSTLGDLFSCHIIDNPSIDSEIYLLKQYGPNVNDELLKNIVNAFSELRTMTENGQLLYPYSTREVINIVKHLEKYPFDNITTILSNVIDFEQYSYDTFDMIVNVFIKHNINIDKNLYEIFNSENHNNMMKKRKLFLTIEKNNGKSVTSPKHGKVDEKNEPHVGGNTWAGGTGGRDTAGLGGKGGPYRLDSGHQVHQLSDLEKSDVPDHIVEAAKKMNRKAFEDKLKSIKMSIYDDSIYRQYLQPIQHQIKQMHSILDQMKFKSNERQWIKHQTHGEFDDNKLIESLTGEKNIYRHRTMINNNNDNQQLNSNNELKNKPKRLKLIVDVSGSMYRFNGYDLRLDRQLELIVMCMESFYNYENLICYDIIGHSGETHNIEFVRKNCYPQNNKERLEILQMMHAHAQFCWSGDNTLTATKYGIESIVNEKHENDDCEDAIVVILSDANLSRYNIPVEKFSNLLMQHEPNVHSYVIFIGSLDNEAQM